MVWNELKDEILLREVLLIEPYKFKPRKKESGNAWKIIADTLNDFVGQEFQVDQRTVRDHFNTLKLNYEAKVRTELKATGIAPDEFTPVESALEDILEQIKEIELQRDNEECSKTKKNENMIERPQRRCESRQWKAILRVKDVKIILKKAVTVTKKCLKGNHEGQVQKL